MATYRLKRLIVTTCALCCFASYGYATTLLAHLTETQVFVAADSKVIWINEGEARGCKILVARNHIFASTGLLNALGFNVFEVARKAINSEADHSSIVSAYEKEMTALIPSILKQVRSLSVELFDRKFRGQIPFNGLFATAENGALKTSYIAFGIGDKGEISVIRQDCPGSCGDDITEPWFIDLGFNDAVQAELARNPKIWKNLGIPGAMNKLITLQAAATPKDVGGPVSIVTMRSDGKVEWNQAGQCFSFKPGN